MEIIKASSFGILPNEDITEKLCELTEKLKEKDNEKTVVFDKGTY